MGFKVEKTGSSCQIGVNFISPFWRIPRSLFVQIAITFFIGSFHPKLLLKWVCQGWLSVGSDSHCSIRKDFCSYLRPFIELFFLSGTRKQTMQVYIENFMTRSNIEDNNILVNGNYPFSHFHSSGTVLTYLLNIYFCKILKQSPLS